MSLGSFSAALSGLNANGQALSVIGNNLANMNTIGFKASTVAFADLVSQNVGGTGANPAQIGLGVGTGSISPTFSQGSIENTTSPTNAAIQGNGFFVVAGPQGNSYTRAGNFALDQNGKLATADGQFVQGYTAVDPVTKKIVTTGQPSDITIPLGVLRPPVSTTQFSTTSNLNAAALVNDTFSASIQIYDSLGTPHVATMNYKNTAAGAWTYSLEVPGAEITGGVVGTPFVLKAGTLTFDPMGKLLNVDGAAAANVTIVTPTWKDGAAISNITWAILDASKNATISGFNAPSATSSIGQNGSAPGLINLISISPDGSVVATFGAGQSVAVAQLALANFNNPNGLLKIGSNRYGTTDAAGLPSIGTAGTGGRGTLVGSALEQSNVDIASEFTSMILSQRGYQANSKTITTSDQLLVDTLNLKQ